MLRRDASVETNKTIRIIKAFISIETGAI